MVAFGESLSFDRRLAEADVRGSVAHAKMLAKQRIINKAEAAKIVKGLNAVLAEIRSGKFPYRADLEDIHMNVEARLVEKIGAVGKKLHTGRSRNDKCRSTLDFGCEMKLIGSAILSWDSKSRW